MNPAKMNRDNITELTDRGVVRVSGPDRLDFLQNLLTCNMNVLQESKIVFGGLLTPQGKILFDFFIIESDGAVLVDIQKSTLHDFVKRLNIYRLRTNIEVEDLSASHNVIGIWNPKDKPATPASAFEDPRMPELGFRAVRNVNENHTSTGLQPATLDDYHRHRIHLGVPAGEYDFTYSSVFPHDVNMDILNGIDFSKGCFVGQEVVSRMKHRGTAKRRIIKAKAKGSLPEAGTEIQSGGKVIGTLGGNAEDVAIAQVRLDRVRLANDSSEPFMAGDVEISLVLPDWIDFT